jgi:hypothetical protein
MAVDFGLLQQPNIAGGAIQALGQGRQVGMEDARRRILSGYGEDRAGAISQLMAIDPSTAIDLQRGNAAEKAGEQAGQHQDQEAIAQGHTAIAGLLGVIQRQTTDPAERRAMALHVVQQLGAQMSPEQAQALTQEAEQFDYSDQGIAAYRATFLPHHNPTIIQGRNGSYSYADPDTGERLGGYDAPTPPLTAVEQARADYYRAQTDYTHHRAGLTDAQAERARRPPAARGGGRGRRGGGHPGAGGASGVPVGFELE